MKKKIIVSILAFSLILTGCKKTESTSQVNAFDEIQMYITSEDYVEAEALIDDYIATPEYKENPQMYIKKAEVAAQLNKYDNLNKALQQAEAYGAEKQDYLKLEGAKYFKAGSYDKALESYQAAQILDATDDEIYANVGQLYFELGNDTEAQIAAKEAIALNVKSFSGYDVLLKTAIQSTDYDIAQNYTEKLLDLYPTYTYAQAMDLYLKAEMLQNSTKENLQEIYEAYDKWMQEEDATAYSQYAGMILAKQLELKPEADESVEVIKTKAINHLLAAEVVHPRDASIYSTKSYIYYMTGSYDEALKAIDKALEIQENQADFYVQKAYIYATQHGEDDEQVQRNLQKAYNLRVDIYDTLPETLQEKIMIKGDETNEI